MNYYDHVLLVFLLNFVVYSNLGFFRINMSENNHHHQQQQQQRFQLGTIGALSLSVVSSVSIVICNKALITTLGFCFGQYVPSNTYILLHYASFLFYSFFYLYIHSSNELSREQYKNKNTIIPPFVSFEANYQTQCVDV